MKQVININFQGRVVPIEVTAFDMLKAYTDSLNRYFAAEEGKDEIINDIESRIGELFQERIKEGATCITEDDVNAIIRSMGRPEDFETEGGEGAAADSSYTQTPPFNATGTMPKKLYRDENDKVVGGVCSGLANYFGIDVVVIRILFVVLAISAGFGLLTYIILWIAVPSTASMVIGGVRKKLYRDTDDKFIGGVCSGIANYFGINVWIPRVLFLLPFLSFVSRWGDWGNEFPNILRFGFSPTALLVYVILWMVLPEATTTAEKLEMKGEKVDMNSIKNSVMEEMRGVQQRAEKFGREAKDIAKDRGQVFAGEVGTVAKRGGRTLGDIIALLFKIFAYFILACMGFALVVGLFALGIFSVGIFPLKDFLLTEGWQNALAWGTLIFFIAVPIVGIITWLIRRIAKVNTNRKAMRASFISLWIVGWVCFFGLISSIGRDFKSSSTLGEEDVTLVTPGVQKLEITSNSPDKKYYRNRWFRMEPFEGLMDEDTAYVKNVTIHVLKSPNDSFKVSMIKLARGRTRAIADRNVSLMNFNAYQMDSLLLIDRGIPINKQDKFRNQRIILTVYVPVGKQIRIDKSVGWGHNVSFGWNDSNDWDIEFEDVERGWDHNIDYVMQTDGLYTLDGNPADTWKQRRNNRNNKKIRVTPGNENDNYRYDNNDVITPLDSMKLKLQQEERRTKDSLQRVKERIEQQLKKIEENEVDGGTAIIAMMPSYSPMLNIY